MIFKTTSLQQAATLMSQNEFPSIFKELQPVYKTDKFEFVFELTTTEEVFQVWINEYINKRVCVEPKTYHQAVNVLRDNLNNYRFRKGIRNDN